MKVTKEMQLNQLLGINSISYKSIKTKKKKKNTLNNNKNILLQNN